MRGKNQRFFIFILVLITLFTTTIPSFAEWQGVIPDWWVYRFNTIFSKEYNQVSGGMMSYNLTYGTNDKHSTLVPMRLANNLNYVGIEDSSKLNDYNLTIKKVESRRYWTEGMGNVNDFKDPGELILDNKKHDYFLPYKHFYKFTYDSGRKTDKIPVWMMLIIERNSQEQTPKEEVQDLWDEFISVYEELDDFSREIKEQGQPRKSGDYHPMHAGFIDNIKRELNAIINPGWNADPRLEYVYVWIEKMYNPKTIDPNLKREQIEALLETCYEAMEYVKAHRVNEAEILEVKYKNYTGIIDKNNNNVKLYIPQETEIDKDKLEILTPDWVKAKFKSGDFEIGKSVVYTIKALDALHEKFKDVKDYDVKQDWTIEFIEGESEQLINSARYTSPDGNKIEASISDDEINLNIPFEVDLISFPIEIYHTAEKLFYIDKNKEDIEFKDGDLVDVSKPLDIKLKTGDKEKTYKLNVVSNKSDENQITSFKINGSLGKIDPDNGEIIVTVPFEADISNLKPNIKTSYKSTILPRSNEVQDFSKGSVIYTVKSESGKEKTYRVQVKKAGASQEKEILSFKIGTIEGKIKDNIIEIELPSSIKLDNIKPTIEVSKFAEISPKSGEEVDFSSKKFIYTVTAQDGSKKEYIVNIQQEGSGGEIEFPDKEFYKKLITLRDNIYKRYKEDASDDWEWMNIGFYEGRDNGKDTTNGVVDKYEDIPKRFNIYGKISSLNPNKQTDPDRFVMTLTAMGIDATDLKKLQKDGKPFMIKGEEVTDLVERIYNFPTPIKDTTVNDQIFGLIALDMGNYSVPADTRYSREFMIEYILNHKYGTDGFGIDMVGMLMQSLYPYRDDPVYGIRVKEKLDEGLDIILGHKVVEKVNSMRDDFLFDAWGAVNNESTAQVIIALCSMGIDPYSDYRFSKGSNNNMIVNWINKFATNDLDGFGHANKQYNPMGTYQGMYALQWYINFIENGKKPYSLYKDGVPFEFGKEFSKEAKIDKFVLLGKEAIINHETGSIVIELSNEVSDEELKEQVPIINISKGATISPEIGEKQDFTKDIEYIVTAEDGKTVKKYMVKVQRKEGVESSKKDIIDGKVEGFSNAKIEIDNQNQNIKIELPAGTNESELKNLKIYFNHQGVNISPDETEPQDFTNGTVVEYTVTAEDGTSRKYKVQVTIKEEDLFWFTRFVLRGVNGKIDKNNRKIHLRLPFGTYVEEIYINESKFEPSDSNTSVRPGLGQPQNYSYEPNEDKEKPKVSIVPYPLPSSGTIDYEVDIEYISPTGNSKIEEFSVPGVETNIKGNTIELRLPKGIDKYDIKDLIPKIKWTGKTIDPEPNKENNSLKDYYKDYVLTDEEGNINLYTIKIVESGGDSNGGNDKDKEKEEMKIESFKIKGIEGEIDNVNGKIYIELPYELDLRNLSPTIKTSKGSNIYPASGQPLNLRRSARFTLNNGKDIKEYKLIITISEPKPATKLWEYIDDYNDTEDYQVVY
ncbi:Putative glycoside hydrolase [Tissierella praeacuta]|uniref:hypothetical protein n=1 Tax=Tissierella praeacuta TaxID=43131 RepID=UPI000E07F4AF|nr:hypothetical protein [Tissierella praeacuta]SUP00339.1 Putative glycoside hydrolase [Tissierella praeacuta]